MTCGGFPVSLGNMGNGDDAAAAALQYWGFSYGTVLGMTYATLFADQVKRMVLDGVVNASAWYSGNSVGFLRDTDGVMDRFFRYCHLAGNIKCAFTGKKNLREGEAEGVARLRKRLINFLARLKENPLPVGGGGVISRLSPSIVTYADAKRLIREAVYEPLDKFPILATILADLDEGNGSSLVEYKARTHNESRPYHCLTPDCQNQATCRETCRMMDDFRFDVCTAITCLDINHRLSMISREEYYEHYLQPVMRQSSWHLC